MTSGKCENCGKQAELSLIEIKDFTQIPISTKQTSWCQNCIHLTRERKIKVRKMIDDNWVVGLINMMQK